jgi:methyl-accepting chemotaxis protein
MAWFANLSLVKKLYGLAGVLLACLVLLGLYSINSISSVGQQGSDIYASNAVALDQLGIAATAFTDEQRQVLRGIVYSQDRSVQQAVDTTIAADQATFTKQINEFAAVGLSPTEAAAVGKLRPAVAAYLPLRDKVRAATKAGDVSAARTINNQAVTEFNTVQASLNKLTDFNRNEAATASKDIKSTTSSTKTLTIILLVLALALGSAVAFATVRQITHSVKRIIERMAAVEKAARERLTVGMHALADGDLTVKLEAGTAPETNYPGDELGKIMKQCEGFRNAILDSYAAYNQTTEKLRGVIGELSNTAESVGEASHQMASTSEETGRATAEIAQAIGDVAQGAERQVDMIESARRAAEEVSEAVRQSAEQAEQAAEVATQARETAQHGVDAAEQANVAMYSVRDSSEGVTVAIRELAAKSEQIGAIVQTITGIAEQTNLLALNAAIEAARAGEQGKGFAVVAEEVRKLAEESQRAAHEISELIGAIQDETAAAVHVVEDGAQKTADGVTVVEQAREAFLTIGQAVEDMTARVEQIAASAEEIAASAATMQESIGEASAVAEESSASTEEVSASTEETSASTEQIAAGAAEMATSAETLRGLVGHFQLDSGSSRGRKEA